MAFGQHQQPEQDQADDKWPADEAFILHAFYQVGEGEGDESDGEQVGRPAKQGHKGPTNSAEEGHRAKHGQDSKEKESQQ